MVNDKGLNFHKPDYSTLQIDLSGQWLLALPLPSSNVVFNKIESEPGIARIIFDTTGLAEWDTGLLTFLISLIEHAAGKNINIDSRGLPKGVNKLIALASRTQPKRVERTTDQCKIDECPTFLAYFGAECEGCAESAFDIIEFIGDAFISFFKMLRGKASFRGRDLKYLIQDAGANTLPIVTLISMLTGMILAFVGAVQLEMFDAEIFVANLVGLGMAREMGALMTGIILAGRAGASYAAQIGSMQVNEELDALTTLGVSTMEFIALPRIIALVLMTPLLCVYAVFLGILGGAIVSAVLMDIPTVQYISQVQSAVSFSDFAAGIIKGSLFGFIVGVVGCLRGFQSGRSASAVGEATTSAVVTSIVVIVMMDALLTIIFNITGI